MKKTYPVTFGTRSASNASLSRHTLKTGRSLISRSPWGTWITLKLVEMTQLFLQLWMEREVLTPVGKIWWGTVFILFLFLLKISWILFISALNRLELKKGSAGSGHLVQHPVAHSGSPNASGSTRTPRYLYRQSFVPGVQWSLAPGIH